MLSTNETRDGVIQIVDFGCAHVEGEDDDDDDHEHDEKKHNAVGFTPAYSSPEAFERNSGDGPCAILPPVDMWALGVIVYIMLTGIHPFDIQGTSSDEEIERDICNKDLPLPLGSKYSFAKHISPSAQDLIKKLMNRDPKQRLSAYEMLHHEWVTGETASTRVIVGSDRRLNKFRKFRTKIQTQFFADAVQWSDEAIGEETRKRTSLIERSFKAFDGSDTAIKRMLDETQERISPTAVSELAPLGELALDDSETPKPGESLTMSDYSDLLSENMKQRYFPKVRGFPPYAWRSLVGIDFCLPSCSVLFIVLSHIFIDILFWYFNRGVLSTMKAKRVITCISSILEQLKSLLPMESKTVEILATSSVKARYSIL